MATDTPASDDPRAQSFGSRPARTPPTLDLKAEEPPAAQDAALPPAEAVPPAADLAPDAPADAGEAVPPEAAAGESAEQAAEAAVAADAEPATPAADPPPAPAAPARSGSVLAALIAGVIGGAAAGGGLWYGLPLLVPPAAPPPAPPPVVQPAPRVDLTPLQNRIAALEARPSDASAIAALSTRLERSEATLRSLENTVAGLKAAPASAPSAPAATAVPPALAKSVEDLRTGADAAREALALLRREVDALKAGETALQTATAAAAAGVQQAGAQIQALAPQVQAIGPRLDALKTQIEEAAAAASRFNRAAAGLVVLASFRDAVVSGRPFAAELAAARVTLPAGAAQLDPFAASASEGFAPPARLAARLAQEGGAAIGTPAPPAGDGASLVDRLMASAENLVKVRPATGPGSVDAEGVLASAVAQVRAGQLDDALRTLKQLPESVQQRLSVLRDIEARANAVRVAGTLYQQQLVAISGKVP